MVTGYNFALCEQENAFRRYHMEQNKLLRYAHGSLNEGTYLSISLTLSNILESPGSLLPVVSRLYGDISDIVPTLALSEIYLKVLKYTVGMNEREKYVHSVRIHSATLELTSEYN
ncbi:hypothetical protein DPMN_115706 [Dreissena polymorpha]|uniref:Uncharacterized protein n=1 Tax=Dreissena polymorpha TaxID=45954 RepID=A0A9D4KLP0_DREPO|nr:hypothetical protein DPMN_115706 [Dreissena polymorpha]